MKDIRQAPISLDANITGIVYNALYVKIELGKKQSFSIK